jgi:hypothetical protein
MSTEVQLEQSSAEERVYPLDFEPALLEGVTLTGVDVTHVPPSGAPLVISGTVIGNIGYVPLPTGLVLGVHLFSVIGLTTNADHSPEILLIVTVLR